MKNSKGKIKNPGTGYDPGFAFLIFNF